MDRTSALRAAAIAAVAAMVFLGFGAAPATARAVHVEVPNDLTILAPYEPTGAILADISAFYILTPTPQGVIPQGGDWSLDWAGGGGLAAGHYEGKMNCNVYITSMEEDGSLLHAWAECVYRSPGKGVIVANPIWVTVYYTCPGRMEWDMHITATGVYAGLSGDGVAWVEIPC